MVLPSFIMIIINKDWVLTQSHDDSIFVLNKTQIITGKKSL